MWVNTDTKPYEVFCICRWPDFITDASDTLLPLSLSLAPQVIQRILLISHCVCHSMTPYFFEKQYLPGSLMSNKFVSVYVCVWIILEVWTQTMDICQQNTWTREWEREWEKCCAFILKHDWRKFICYTSMSFVNACAYDESGSDI